MAGFVRVIWVSREAEYFCARDWTGQIKLKLLGKIDLSRKSVVARASYFEREVESLRRWLTAGPSYRAVPALSRALRRTCRPIAEGPPSFDGPHPACRASRHHRDTVRAINDGVFCFDLSCSPMSDRHSFGSPENRAVHRREFHFPIFNLFEVTPLSDQCQSASGLGQSPVRQRSPCLRAAVGLV